MTTQFPDLVTFAGSEYAIAAVDGHGLFQPAQLGIEPQWLSTACWRGYLCKYAVVDQRLLLREVELGLPDGAEVPKLFGVAGAKAGRRSLHSDAKVYRRLAAPIEFTGRLLIGADQQSVGYLHMGFDPAWLYERVYELAFSRGRLTASADRSAEAAELRDRLGAEGLGPRDDEDRRDWIRRTFSQSFGYSLPTTD